jgi:hypothetical protein
MGAPEVSVGMANGSTAILAVTDLPACCPTCGSGPPEGARFCSHCGAALPGDSGEADQLLDPLTSYVVERRLYGVPPPELLCALAAIGFVVAFVLFAGGRWVAASVVVVLALTFGGMFISTAVRFPESRIARAAVASRRWMRGRLVVVGESLAAWSHAVGEILRLARKRRKLRAELNAQVGRLGEAVYADDPDLACYLKAEAHAISEQLDELERRQTAVSSNVRQQIDQAKDAIRSTAEPIADANGDSGA